MWAALLCAAPLVVLDPGHGGAAEGVTAGELQEADVTLDVAVAAARALREQGFDVRLTRTVDADLSLGARISKAAGADAFVSLHVNSSPATRRRGTETYVAAIDGVEAAVISPGEGGAAPEAPAAPGLAGILTDLQRRGARRRAADLAARVQARVAAVPGMGPDRGVRQAPFAVVQNAKVPAVLVEMGFMTHPEQRDLLADPAHRRALGVAVAEGIAEFLNR